MSKTKTVLGVDPGTTKTAYAVYSPSINGNIGTIKITGKIDNATFLNSIPEICSNFEVEYMAIEMMASMGMAVGQTTLETAVWIGRFLESWLTCKSKNNPGANQEPYQLIYRIDEKLHLCGTPRAKDANIRQAIIDRYGGVKGNVIGTKKAPGPLYGVSADMWAAIAVCLVASEVPEDQRSGKGSIRL